MGNLIQFGWKLTRDSGTKYRGADKSLARPRRIQVNVSVRMERRSFGALPCRKKKNLLTARVSMLLKPRASLTRFRACFLPGRAKNLSEPLYNVAITLIWSIFVRKSIKIATGITYPKYPYYYGYHHHHHQLLYAGYLYLYSWDKLCP